MIAEIKNFSKKYARSDKLAVNDISFNIKEGEIIGFIGPNGAGKSTTIKCMTGILSYKQGTIKVLDTDLNQDPIFVKSNIGFVPDEHMAYDLLTGRELIDFIASVHNVDNDLKEKRMMEYAKLFSLENDLDNLIKTYSHGMKQKISIIAALVHEPKLWILDEPLTGLDPMSSFNLKKIMKEFCKKGHSVFFSSHVLEVVEKLCDRIIIINKGKIILECTLEELHDRQKGVSLEEFFISMTSGSINNETKEADNNER